VAFLLFCGGFGVLKPGVWCRGGVPDVTAADRSPGGVPQGLDRCVEAESVKNVALRQKVKLRVKKYSLVLSQINQKTTRSQGTPGDRV